MSDAETSEPQKSDEEASRESIQVWVEELARHLEIEDAEIDIDALLKLAGHAAHTVVRPAAPVTTYVIGYVTGLAVASGWADDQTASREASRVAEQLLKRRSQAAG